MDGSLTIDRLSRSLIDLLGTIHTLEACGVDLCLGALSVLTLILPTPQQLSAPTIMPHLS
jgi:hypothetical protein